MVEIKIGKPSDKKCEYTVDINFTGNGYDLAKVTVDLEYAVRHTLLSLYDNNPDILTMFGESLPVYDENEI